MSKILIVEDNELIRNSIIKIIREIDDCIEIISTEYSSKALDISIINNIDIFILDIGLKDYSGIKLGQELRKLNKYIVTPIIFITAMINEELEAFREIHSYAFITKPFKKEKVKNILAPVIQSFTGNEQENNLTINQKEETYIIPMNEIIYIEAQLKRIYIHTLNDEYEIKTYTLNKLSQELNDNFMRVHRSYIINKKYITKIDRTKWVLHLKNITRYMPVSRKYKNQLMELLQ
ncbi:LytR/AlgR family response regulator transcription factor [Senegalia massiliensis]|uniref:LytR/AlgR family response regulator transcription factor n=1 Tax=Senegalia massiliensis TaxID=1720316 RepID=UPI001031E80B|nr:LytTR family DNA-binding domain-containing protein [Senegalia massiliensis]